MPAEPSPLHVWCCTEYSGWCAAAGHTRRLFFSRFAISAGAGLDLIATPLPRPPTLFLHPFLLPSQPPFYPFQSLYSLARHNHTSAFRFFIAPPSQLHQQVSYAVHITSPHLTRSPGTTTPQALSVASLATPSPAIIRVAHCLCTIGYDVVFLSLDLFISCESCGTCC